jgi:hypothetical protein
LPIIKGRLRGEKVDFKDNRTKKTYPEDYLIADMNVESLLKHTVSEN